MRPAVAVASAVAAQVSPPSSPGGMQCGMALPVVKSMTVLVTGPPLHQRLAVRLEIERAQARGVRPAVGDDHAVVLHEDRDALAVVVRRRAAMPRRRRSCRRACRWHGRRCRRAGSSARAWGWRCSPASVSTSARRCCSAAAQIWSADVRHAFVGHEVHAASRSEDERVHPHRRDQRADEHQQRPHPAAPLRRWCRGRARRTRAVSIIRAGFR